MTNSFLRWVLLGCLFVFVSDTVAKEPEALGEDGALETAPFKVVKKAKDYEERLYAAGKWVQTSVKHSNQEAAFWKLFNYITGAGNERNASIAMTTPVTMKVEVDCASKTSVKKALAFFISPAFQKDPPKPLDPLVSIEERPEITVLARTFGGFTDDLKVVQEEHAQLWSSLSDEDKNRVNINDDFYTAGYNRPSQLTDRRNDIWMVVRGPEDSHTAKNKDNQQSCF